MEEELEYFILQIPNFKHIAASELIDYFSYFLLINQTVTAGDIENCFNKNCFNICRIKKYSNISSYLSRYSIKKNSQTLKFIKKEKGYILERNFENEIKNKINQNPKKIEISKKLRDLAKHLTSPSEIDFLSEAIDCYEIGARRASIILVWILTINHLYEYVFIKQLSSFNAELAKNTDKRIKISTIGRQ